MPYIYKIVNKVNGKIYIGKTTRSIQERWHEHKRDALKETNEKRPLYSAIKKYGIENFYIEEIEECDISILEQKERYWIEHYNSFKYGYNATQGGDGRPYIDRELIIKLYKKYGTCSEVSKITKHDPHTIASILKENKINTKPSNLINLERYGRPVVMADLNNNFLQAFKSLHQAALYIKENKKLSATQKSIATNISRATKKERKTAYGYIWQFL